MPPRPPADRPPVSQPAPAGEPFAYFGGVHATGLLDVVDLGAEPEALDRGGWWAVVATFEGSLTGYRFAATRRAPLPRPVGSWSGPPISAWRSSIDRAGYVTGVHRIHRYIEAGEVYQVNLCRLLSAALPGRPDPLALAHRLAGGNPAPYQGVLVMGEDQWVVTASPELFLSRRGGLVSSSPIKGTTGPGEAFADKDPAENIMITDLVRNDLGRIARPGSVTVTELLARQEHPGLAHLVSTVTAMLARDVGWAEILAATFPPGSVTGAPKIRALQVISELERVPRGPYCGAIGYVDADTHRADLAVGIRTFFTKPAGDFGDIGGTELCFGTGAGITYSSDPEAEWAETELKAARLITLASRARQS